ncbi:polysaccharide deacetylase family protein [Parasphingopyxis algicola]|uniref:polysaccharide deacetylase family protein n=1 Tax=Parasphingopyxis algicola TaxID=2026624 RepID=UPI0015A29F02|nr:polysaccharide deacetylase family protein [Parasphingopyxis algicola]QLC26369.1 polysaccharide deacetylase family protein [Parasphingopyxis algicola]
MPLGPEAFDYPNRRYGMDHDRYDWSLLKHRPPVEWPGGKKVALWITVAVEFFPLDDDGQPFRLPGSVAKPYPDMQTYTWRDYGNRVGIYRLMRAFDEYGVTANWAVNGAIAEMLPCLVRDIDRRNEEVLAHGWDMASPHFGGMGEDRERVLIDKTIQAIRQSISSPVQGWISPGKSESAATPDFLAEAGIGYVCDWPNDDMPYFMHNRGDPLVAMPHSNELDDRQIIVEYKHHESAFVQQVLDQYRYLSREAAAEGGRILSLNLHPWVVGQSHRIVSLEAILAELSAQADIWSASGSEIVDCWRQADASVPPESKKPA